ncbi:uncharacterized protein UV8b_06042 [Ustilaginoidea virens]|uniref:Protein kinase domain-containing protein n=1 Tax=Ustilaginoidea virens TaxID=1159556 RepID=A0A063BYS3_USTVR|nr:uncharacterized protein UV8b_06042 [Ustilaginoidea virens]QUC21801.1 hypothetical protein UV8b_06042 [Ustilaginoidea virens]GAO19885.1 hypothetical protein UVI_02051110 [Ustilaginoidea virens]
MTPQNPRSITVLTGQTLPAGQDPRQFDWRSNRYLCFEVYDGFDAWSGRLQWQEHRKDWPEDGVQADLSKFDELIKLLRPIPREKIYPEFPTEELTRYEPQQQGNGPAPYLKAPKPGHYQDGSDDLASRLLNEAMIYEKVLNNPHPNLASYLGCVVEEGRIVRLALKRYNESIDDRCQRASPDEFTLGQRMACMDQIEAAAEHLHSLGLAHNDISPSNIMFDDDGRPVLIDFDACAPLGDPLAKGGLVTGWKGPIAGEGLEFKQSSAICDKLAIQEIRKYLAEGLE